MDTKDYELGKRIESLLRQHGVENPIVDDVIDKWQQPEYLNELEQKIRDFLETLGLDIADRSVANTPGRVAEFVVEELFYGLDYHNFPRVFTHPNSFNYKTPLISNKIRVNSTCEHHLVGIQGMAIVGYVPAAKIVGLSKINRVVDFFAKRPQVQERMTRQIFLSLQEILQTNDVAVAINAKHNCIAIRGVQDTTTENLTLELGGVFLNDEVLKAQFYQSAFKF